MRFACLLSFFLFLSFFSHSQTSFKKQELKVKRVGTINLSGMDDKWMPLLENLEMPKPGGEEENEELEEIKKQLSERFSSKKANKTDQKNSISSFNTAPSPTLGTNFEGNVIGSNRPNDNDMAISNGGKIVSVINTVIYVFDINNLSAAPWKKSLESFAIVNDSVPKNTIGFNNAKYDPKVIYDPVSDKFILVMLNGFNSTYSKIIVAFSQTNDPTGEWNIYTLSGNPVQNKMWTDYPQIAMTKEDFFITINLLTDTMYPGPKPWEKEFKDDVIWQMNKQKGYDGTYMNTTFYHDVRYNGKLIQYMCPIKGGNELLGPNMYFVSNRSFSAGNDSIFLTEVTNSVNSGLASVNALVAKSDVEYYVPPNAEQPGSGDHLLTNDARILGGFLHNGQIQFVFPSTDTSTGFSGIYHGIIKNITSSGFEVTAKILGNPEKYYGYPNISYSGSETNHVGISPAENESIITFDHSSSSSYPGISAIFYNNDGTYSDAIEVKKGDTIIYSPDTSSVERWGDYTGSQLKYNEYGKVWVSGTFGSKGTNGHQKKYGTWIAEVSSPNVFPAAPETSKMLIFPNPSADVFSLDFSLEKDMEITIKIYDTKGALVHRFIEKYARAGQNIFSFSTVPLNKGVYLISVEAEGKIIFKDKIDKN
jgi:hypothetical protein